MTSPLSSTLRGRARAAAVGPGTEFWIKKTMTSSALLTASAVDITGVSDGRLAILDVILKTDQTTGLAGGTNFQLFSNNAVGGGNIMATAISGLGAGKTVDLANATVTKVKTILESGKKLQVQNSSSIGTGSGTVEIWVRLQRIDENATIAAL